MGTPNMKSNFDASLALVLVHEGGWADHPSDPGGATMKGVTIATYKAYLGREVTKTELRNIPDAHLKDIYFTRYWQKVEGDDLPIGVDLAVFDFAVNSGPGRAIKAVQKVTGADQDGIVGSRTLASIDAQGHRATIEDLCAERLRFLKRLKTWATFGAGWERRVAEVRASALAMLAQEAPRADWAPTQPPAPSGRPGASGAATGAGGLAAGGAAIALSEGHPWLIVLGVIVILGSLGFATRRWWWPKLRQVFRK